MTLPAEFSYDLRPVERGYANRTLYINLEDNTIYEKPIAQQMSITNRRLDLLGRRSSFSRPHFFILMNLSFILCRV
jgi:hypothetical protein